MGYDARKGEIAAKRDSKRGNDARKGETAVKRDSKRDYDHRKSNSPTKGSQKSEMVKNTKNYRANISPGYSHIIKPRVSQLPNLNLNNDW